ncbi:MAG: ABC transporter substrate-binding protein [Rhizobacter sp.]|nr:ABC transporter substrate-binding protein [Bacteriovorax sp.]
MRYLLVFAIFLFSISAIQAKVIKVGSSPTASSAGIYLAKERGYFKEQGLEVEVTDFNNSGAPMTVLLSKGELDVGAGNITAGLFNAIAQGQKFKIVADKGHIEKNKDYLSLIVRTEHIKSGRYKSLKNLKGFKMGLTSLDGVSQEILTEKFLKKAGLKLEDVTFVKVSYAEMNLALKSGAIDATIQIEPFLTKAIQDGIATKVNGGSEVYPKQQSGALFYSPQFIKDNEIDAKKFMVAYSKGIRDYNQAFEKNLNKQSVIDDLKKSIKIDDASVWEKMAIVGLNEYGKLNVKELKDDIDWYQKRYIKEKLEANDIIDESFTKFAAENLK